MNWFTKAFTSTLGRKLVMALSGLFLCTFLLVHVSGNFQLFKDDGGMSFNMYTVFMTHNPLIKTTSYLLYLTFLVHIFQSLLLVIHNRKARPQGYVKNSPEKNSTWSSRNMGILGTIILVFLVIHMKDFWWEYKQEGAIPQKTYFDIKYKGESKIFDNKDSAMAYKKSFDPNALFMEILKKRGINLEVASKDQQLMEKLQMEFMAFTANYVEPEMKSETVKDLYAEVEKEMKEPWIVLLYLIAMAALAFHLVHGFQSAWQSVGMGHRKYVPIIQAVGWFFSIVIPAAFASMPLYFFLK